MALAKNASFRDTRIVIMFRAISFVSANATKGSAILERVEVKTMQESVEEFVAMAGCFLSIPGCIISLFLLVYGKKENNPAMFIIGLVMFIACACFLYWLCKPGYSHGPRGYEYGEPF